MLFPHCHTGNVVYYMSCTGVHWLDEVHGNRALHWLHSFEVGLTHVPWYAFFWVLWVSSVMWPEGSDGICIDMHSTGREQGLPLLDRDSSSPLTCILGLHSLGLCGSWTHSDCLESSSVLFSTANAPETAWPLVPTLLYLFLLFHSVSIHVFWSNNIV